MNQLGLGEQQLARLGGPHVASWPAVDQALPVLPLQGAQLLAHGGLGHEVEPRGAREAARLDQVAT